MISQNCGGESLFIVLQKFKTIVNLTFKPYWASNYNILNWTNIYKSYLWYEVIIVVNSFLYIFKK